MSIEFLAKQIPYIYSFKRQILTGVLLGGVVIFIMIFLQPFDTYSFESNHKYLIFSGFGLVLFIIYMFCTRIENLWYNHKSKRWSIKDEIVSFAVLLFMSSIFIHLYNQVYLNDFFNSKYSFNDYLKHGLWFFQHSIVPVMFILLPFYLYIRNRFGELVTAESLSEIEISGINKGEKIVIQKEDILYIKASENYVQIFYSNDKTIQQKTFRNTLTAMSEQAPFLYRSHRSYLVNISSIKTIKGNSQNAKIEFHLDDMDIPLSKSYYKKVKSALST